jgi:hypothetical protein
VSDRLDYAQLAERLKKERLVDVDTMLKPGGRAEVMSAIDAWATRGLRAYVLVVRGALPSLADAWSALDADEKVDLLVVFNGPAWDAKGWGLRPDQVRSALTGAEPGLHEYFGKGLVQALDRLGQAATGTTAHPLKPEESSGSALPLVGASVAGLLVVGGFAWIVRRRNALAKEQRAELTEAKGSAERTYAELMLVADDLPSADAQDLQLRAADIKRRLDAVLDEAERASKPGDPVVVGRVRQFENELAALRSTMLQKSRRTKDAESQDHGGSAQRGDEPEDGADRVGEIALRREDRSS